MIVYLANKTQFRVDNLSNRIEKIVHDSLKGTLDTSVSPNELTFWKNSLRHMDTVLEDAGNPHDDGVARFFLAQVVGESMNRRIPNGSWCLFRELSDGSRNGKIVLVQSRDIQDPDSGGQYTVKRYSSQKMATPEGWQHTHITLSPDSHDPKYQPIVLEGPESSEFRAIGEYVIAVT